MSAMPTLFLSHGGPNIVVSDTPTRAYLKGLAARLPRPRAIVVMSAHFETGGVVVVTDPRPEMIYDFRGFEPELYEMVYPAPGAPELAGEVLMLLAAAGLDPEPLARRGYDHGTWTPLLLAYPEADIPIVQVSIDPARDAAWHFGVGQALATLRQTGVLVIGSGHITHNLGAFFAVMRGAAAPDPALPGKVKAFTEWFAARLEAGDRAGLLDWKEQAPFPSDNHPTDEHLMPIFFAYGAAGERPHAVRLHDSVDHGFFANDSWLFQ